MNPPRLGWDPQFRKSFDVDTVYFYLGHNLCHHYSESDLMLFCFSLLLFPMSHLHLHVVHRLFSPVVKFVTCCRSVLSHQFPYQRTLSVDFRLLFLFCCGVLCLVKDGNTDPPPLRERLPCPARLGFDRRSDAIVRWDHAHLFRWTGREVATCKWR